MEAGNVLRAVRALWPFSVRKPARHPAVAGHADLPGVVKLPVQVSQKLRWLYRNIDVLPLLEWEHKMVETMFERKAAGIPLTVLQSTKVDAIYQKYRIA